MGIPCASYVKANTPAGVAQCRTGTEPGRACPNTQRHVVPACPKCGRWAGGWHEKAICPPPDAPEGKRGCGHGGRR